MDVDQFCFGLSAGSSKDDLMTLWESIKLFVPSQEHSELQRVLGWSAVERNQGLAEELRVLMQLLDGMEDGGGGGGEGVGGGSRDAFERSVLQQQIAFFVDKMSGKEGGTTQKAPSSPLSLGGPRKSRGSIVGGSSTGSAASRGTHGWGGPRELVQTVLSSGGGSTTVSRENSLEIAPSVSRPPSSSTSTSSAWLWNAPANHSSLECLRAALDAEEEALLADIQFLQGRVCDTAGETREGDAQVLKARKAELQKKWLEMEARSGGSGGGGGGGEGGPLQPPMLSLPTSSTSALRLHRVLNSSSSSAPAAAAAPPRPTASTRGVGVSRVAQAALAERFTAPPSLPQKVVGSGSHGLEAASRAVVDDEARFFS